MERPVSKRVRGQAFEWIGLTPAEIRIDKNEVIIALPRSLFASGPLHFDFKWADSLPSTPSVADFYLHGDVAPNTRFNYRYFASD